MAIQARRGYVTSALPLVTLLATGGKLTKAEAN